VSADPTLGWSKQDCALPLQPSATPDEYMRAVLAEYERLNVTAVVMGDPEPVRKWKAAAPGRIIMGTGFTSFGGPGGHVPIEQLRTLYANGFQVMGEIGLQYEGLSPSDTSVDRYFALAEQLDIPVGIHTGLAPPGTPYGCCPGFSVDLGNPMRLEPMLKRHPKLRVWLMHAGWPYLQETKAILYMYPQVHADLSVINWIIPRQEFHDYLRALMTAGMGDRLMFGSDQMVWPEAITQAVEGIDSAAFLGPAQKRAIFHDNAARFLRIDR